MAIYLEDARLQLAQQAGLMLAGEATGGAVGTIIDTNGLPHITEDDALNGCLAYIRYDAAGGGAAPEGESRRIVDFDHAASTITVEYNWTAAVGAGDLYEVYLARLTLEQWDEAINAAIRDAWPQVWARELYQWQGDGSLEYLLPAEAYDVIAVNVQMTGSRRGWPSQPLPRNMWRLEGSPGWDLFLRLTRPVSPTLTELQIFYKAPFEELTAGAVTELDTGYLLAAAKANLYATLADEAGGQADMSRYLSLMKHWQELAAKRKGELELMLLGAPRTAGEGK